MQQIGRYQIMERLGRGAMGVVYRALDPKIGRTVAVKSIRLAEISDASELKRLRDRLEREARSAGALSHQNIVTIYDILEEEKLVHLFMEYVNGPSLDRMLSERKLPEKAMMLDFLRQIASALDYAHKVGIVHRDVKPSNLMMHFDKSTGEQVAKITDFGVAKFISQQMTQAGSMMGTPNYMSPEQIEGNPISGQTDQFALAAVAYEVLTGEKPFVADYLPTLFFHIVREKPQAAERVNAMLDGNIDAVLQRGLSKVPDERYETCTDLVSALIDACEAHPDWSPPYPMGTLAAPVMEEVEAPVRVASAEAFAATMAEPSNPARALAVEEQSPVAAPPMFPVAAPPPPAAEETQSVPPYELPPPRRRDWDEEETEGGLPLWRKVAIGLILLVMAAVGFVVYRNYTPAGDSGHESAETAQGAANSAPPGTAQPSQTAPAAPPSASTPGSEVNTPRSEVQQNQPQTPPPFSDEPAKTPVHLQPKSRPLVLPENSRARSQASTSLMVQFSSDPSNGRVVVDGDQGKVCLTPCAIPLRPGRHTLTVTAANYGIAHRIIQVPDQHDVFVPLAQNIGIVQVDSIPNGATVWVDGRMLGQTPTTIKLSAGPHQVRLVSGQRSHQETIDVSADSLQQFTFRWQ